MTVDSLQNILDEFSGMLRRVDEIAEDLFGRHRPHLRCRRGCYYCCTAISVTPIEFAWMSAALSDMRRTGASAAGLGPDSEAPSIPARDDFIATIPGDSELAEARRTPRCALLKNGVCSMYHARPVICRVHGLPLAYPVFEYDSHGRRIAGDDPEVAIVWCDLNFPSVDVARSMGETDIVRMADLHRDLEALNDRFLETEAGAAFRQAAQVPLNPVIAASPGTPVRRPRKE